MAAVVGGPFGLALGLGQRVSRPDADEQGALPLLFRRGAGVPVVTGNPPRERPYPPPLSSASYRSSGFPFLCKTPRQNWPYSITCSPTPQ